MKKIFLFAICISLFSVSEAKCFRKKKKIKASKTEQISTKDNKPSNTLVVSFTSQASGIDRNASKQLEQEIEDFNSKNKNSKLAFELRPWGREGERDYCITAYNQAFLDKFTSIIKEKFNGNNRIFVKENGVCKEKRN